MITFVAVFSTYWAYPTDAILQQCQWSKAYDAIYSVSRTTVWGASVAWLIYTCLSCQAGPLTSILAAPIWTPIARLTYGWYLVHPIVISQNFDALTRGIEYTDWTVASYYTFNAVVSLCLSTLVFFLVEIPAVKLKALLQGKGQRVKRRSIATLALRRVD